MKLIPRQYQQELVDKVEAHVMMGGGNNVIIDSCPASGKSLMMSMIADLFKDDGVVIMINITALLEQISSTLTNIGVKHSIMKSGMEDKFDKDCNVQLIMSQTLYAKVDKFKFDQKFKVLCVDEGQLENEKTSKRTRKNLAFIQPEFKFLFSGTPWDQQGFQFDNVDETYVTVPAQKLIDDGHLATVKYYTTGYSEQIDYSKVKSSGNDYTATSLDEIINTDTHLNNIVTSMNLLNAKNKKTLVFCSSIDVCNSVAEKLKKDGYKAEAVHSKINKKDSENIITAFRENSLYLGTTVKDSITLFSEDDSSSGSEIQCLVSVSKLGIGFDVPSVELGVNIRATKQRGLWNQLAFRQHRAHIDKQFAEVLDFGQCISTHGFPYEHYEPPKRSGDRQVDKDVMFNINEKFSLSKLEVLLTDADPLMPTEVTRKMYDDKLLHILETEKEAMASAKKRKASIAREAAKTKDKLTADEIEMKYIKEVAMLLKTSDNIETIFKSAIIMMEYINGKPISKAGKPYSYSSKWLMEDTQTLLNKYPTKRKHWIKSLRTRARNIIKQNKNLNGLKFFCAFLEEKHLEDLFEYQEEAKQRAEQKALQEENKNQQNSNQSYADSMSISEEELPF